MDEHKSELNELFDSICIRRYSAHFNVYSLAEEYPRPVYIVYPRVNPRPIRSSLHFFDLSFFFLFLLPNSSWSIDRKGENSEARRTEEAGVHQDCLQQIELFSLGFGHLLGHRPLLTLSQEELASRNSVRNQSRDQTL